MIYSCIERLFSYFRDNALRKMYNFRQISIENRPILNVYSEDNGKDSAKKTKIS